MVDEQHTSEQLMEWMPVVRNAEDPSSRWQPHAGTPNRWTSARRDGRGPPLRAPRHGRRRRQRGRGLCRGGGGAIHTARRLAGGVGRVTQIVPPRKTRPPPRQWAGGGCLPPSRNVEFPIDWGSMKGQGPRWRGGVCPEQRRGPRVTGPGAEFGPPAVTAAANVSRLAHHPQSISPEDSLKKEVGGGPTTRKGACQSPLAQAAAARRGAVARRAVRAVTGGRWRGRARPVDRRRRRSRHTAHSPR